MNCPACHSDNPADSRFCHRCGTAIDLTSSPTMTFTAAQEAAQAALMFHPGQKFGERYTIIEEIGHGGMGRVYKAMDHELGKTVVLKMIRPELTSRPGMVDQFRKEALAGISVTHENVVRIHNLGEIDKIRYISMEFIKGENLGEFIRASGSLTLQTCLRIAVQVCQALKAAHKADLVHQDLKPQNVMLDNSGKVYVTDFGLAKSLAMPQGRGRGKVSGTPRYFSPEQARGEESDPRSDIYSFGIILYEMVTGSSPFQADTVEGYIKKHTSEKPAPPSKHNPLVPPGCDRIILKCLEKKKEDRYQSVDELIHDLEDQKKHAHRGGVIETRRKWRERAIAGALIVVVGMAVYGLLRPRPARGLPRVVIMFAENMSGDKSLDERLRDVIPYNLWLALAPSRYINLVPRDAVRSILMDMNEQDEVHHLSRTLDKIAAKTKVDYFLLPSFAKVGDGLSISCTVRRANTAETLGGPDTVTGKGLEDVQFMVQEMSAKVKSRFSLSPAEIAGDRGPVLAKVTSPSLEAQRHYTDGEKYYALGDYAASVRALELAVREDPYYAMAYWKLADSYDYLGDYGKHRANLQKALTLLDRVSDRDRLIIQGYSSYILDESPLREIESYQKLVDLYPHDEEGRALLGSVRRNLEEWDLALDQFDKILADNPKSSPALENKAFIETARGLYERALAICEIGAAVYPETNFFRRQPPLIHLLQGRNDMASADLERALALRPDDMDILELKGNLLQLTGDLQAAGRVYDRIREIGETSRQAPDIRGRLWSASLLMQQGRYGRAREGIYQGLELNLKNPRIYNEIDLRLHASYLELRVGRFALAAETLKALLGQAQDNALWRLKREVLHLSGLAALGLGRIEEAKRTGEELRLSVERASAPNQMRRHDHLMGCIALAEGRPAEAARLFEHAVSLLPSQRDSADEHAFYDEGLARAYELSGNWTRAAEAYQKIISMTTGRLRWGDLFAKSYYRLGRIYQRNGNKAAATTYFGNFLRLWQDADEGLPEVDDARKQLEALKKGP